MGDAEGDPEPTQAKKGVLNNIRARVGASRKRLGSLVATGATKAAAAGSAQARAEAGGASPPVSPRNKKLLSGNAGDSTRSAMGGFAREASARMPKMKGFRRYKTDTSSKAATAKASKVFEVSEPILETVSRIWERELSELPVAKDLPRLAKRCAVYGEEESSLFEVDEGDSRTATEMVRDLLLAFGKRLIRNDDDAAAKLERQLNGVLEGSSVGEEDVDVTQMMLEVVERVSPPIVNVVKAIHQDIVLHATVELKQSLTSKYLTKDVRDASGWRIVVRLPTEGVVHIYHVKREQSLDQGGDKTNHFEFEWELRMTFDGKMREMASAQIRVLNLFLSETMDKKIGDDLKKNLVGDMLVM